MASSCIPLTSQSIFFQTGGKHSPWRQSEGIQFVEEKFSVERMTEVICKFTATWQKPETQSPHPIAEKVSF